MPTTNRQVKSGIADHQNTGEEQDIMSKANGTNSPSLKPRSSTKSIKSGEVQGLWEGQDIRSIKELLTSVNEPQNLESNLKTLNAKGIGGIDGILKILNTDEDVGVTSETVIERRTIFGSNSLPSSPCKSFIQLFIDTFDDATLQILIVSAIISLVIGVYDDPTTGYVEGLAILAAVLIVSVVTAINDYSKEKQFRELSAVNDDVDVVVLRDGEIIQIPKDDIVIGDVISIEAGDDIPCDGIIVKSDGLEIDESALTGEPDDVDKDITDDPFVLSGCTATAGSGTFVTIAVGKDSQWGIIKSHLDKEQDETPLQEKLDNMAAMIGYVGMGAAAATFIAMMIIKIFVNPPYLHDVTVFTHALDAFIIGVTIVVVAVPEGLPLAVTISLAYSTKKMLSDKNLIRHLAACETMGNATNICSDKTGTLTENRMTVVRGYFANKEAYHNNDESGKCIASHKADISDKALQIILNCISCCSTARIVTKSTDKDASEDDSIDDTRPHTIGNKTEAALLLLAQSEWGSKDDTDKRRSSVKFGKPNGSRLFPFSSSRKCMSVLVNHNASALTSDTLEPATPGKRTTRSTTKPNRTYTLYHKGAAEALLSKCTTYLDADGSEKKLTPSKIEEYEKIISDYASNALRCVVLCHRNNVQDILSKSNKTKDISSCTVDDCATYLENNMCLDALVGIADPLRSDVIDAVSTCQRAGIFVRMVTGDNLDTAKAIAKQAGILTDGGISMIGEEFRKLTPSQLDDVLPKLQVLARSSPEDKHILVQRLNGGLMPNTESEWLAVHPGKNYYKERDNLLPGYKEEWCKSRSGGVGEVVGVTGDGTNDGPALKAADVGLSMGISGTDVAKKASDIIIMDDKFSSIVKAVLWGRSVFDNIRKFLQFQLTVNVVALTITFLSAVAGYKPPLNAVMMLWVNLIMDTMGALALGTEPPSSELLDRRPYKRDASLINLPMWRNIIVQATYQLGLLIYLLKQGPAMFGCEDGSTHHFTILFNAFVFCQVFNEFNAREIGDRFDPLRSIGKSPMFVFVIVSTVVAQYLIVEYGGNFTQTYPLTLNEWLITAAYGSLSIPFGFIMRLIPIEEDPNSFAGLEPGVEGGQKDNDEKKKKTTMFLGTLLMIMIPVVCAFVYQLAKEGGEFFDKHEHHHTQLYDDMHEA